MHALPNALMMLSLQGFASESDSTDAAELHIWAGIVHSREAGASGGLGALGLVKQAKKEFETALELNHWRWMARPIPA